jgi:ATP-dependent RNA helicase RhlE
VSLVCVDELQLLKDIEKLIKRSVPQEVIPGFEPDPHAKPEPIQQRRGQGGGARQPRRGEGEAGAKRESAAKPAPRAAKPAQQAQAAQPARREGRGDAQSRDSRAPATGTAGAQPRHPEPRRTAPKAPSHGAPRHDGPRGEPRPAKRDEPAAHGGYAGNRKPANNPGALLGGAPRNGQRGR